MASVVGEPLPSVHRTRLGNTEPAAAGGVLAHWPRVSGIPARGEAEAGGHKSLGSSLEPRGEVTVNEAACSSACL